METCSNPEGEGRINGEGKFRGQNSNVTNAFPNLIYMPNFIRIGHQWENAQIRGGESGGIEGSEGEFR